MKTFEKHLKTINKNIANILKTILKNSQKTTEKPIQNTLNHICHIYNIERDPQTKIAKVWEDNEGALKLANSPIERFTPHSKHFAIKYHWFREKKHKLNISIKHVKTDKQKADIMTKGLTGTDFKDKRQLIMGW